MDVKTVFDGIVASVTDAVNNHGLNIGGATPHDWVTNQPAHLCAKVVIREHGTPFPNFGDTPDQDRRLAPKNLPPFDVNPASDPNPNLIGKTSLTAQPHLLNIPHPAG